VSGLNLQTVNRHHCTAEKSELNPFLHKTQRMCEFTALAFFTVFTAHVCTSPSFDAICLETHGIEALCYHHFSMRTSLGSRYHFCVCLFCAFNPAALRPQQICGKHWSYSHLQYKFPFLFFEIVFRKNNELRMVSYIRKWAYFIFHLFWLQHFI